jgi:hypothetical protein
VNVNNEPVTDTHSILIGLDERRLYLPLIFR